MQLAEEEGNVGIIITKNSKVFIADKLAALLKCFTYDREHLQQLLGNIAFLLFTTLSC